jgi:superfamily II DNA or RNA helicase
MSSRHDEGTEQFSALFPHQREFVDQVTSTSGPGRFLLSAPPGTGKSACLAALAGDFRKRNAASRCLIIAPASLLPMWKDMLQSFGGSEAIGMTPQTYRRLQAETKKEVNIWSTVPWIVVSVDLLKIDQRIEEALAASWDLIIMDEVQSYSARGKGRKIPHKIWNHRAVPLVVATIGLPDPPDWVLKNKESRIVRWTRSNLAGRKGFPIRDFQVVEYELTVQERKVRDRLFPLIISDVSYTRYAFLYYILERRLDSSVYAFEQSVRRMMTAEGYTEVEFDEELELPEDQTNASRGYIDLNIAEAIIELIETESVDTKWERCERLLEELGVGQRSQAILFTDFHDTAQYIGSLANSRGITTFVITGALSLDERKRVLEEARRAPSLLVTTSVAEGLSFGFTNRIIHYDLPVNHVRLLRRCGYVERLTNEYQEFHHYWLLSADQQSRARLELLLKEFEKLEMGWQ